MTVFVHHCNPASARLCGFDTIADVQNQLAASLTNFESAILAKWKSSIDLANAGLRARLLAPSPASKLRVVVNADIK
jgi:hypothetical protein